jgi:hypothetical protein
MRLESSIKIAKLQFIKGLWSSKFSWEKSIDEMMEAYHLFGEAVGDEKNYYGANCLMEIGQNYLRKRDIDSSTQYLNSGVEIYEKLFGDAHPILQKYYNYSSEVFSSASDNDAMMQMGKKYLDIVEKVNKPRDP